jgi:hypothetical protein
MGQYPGFCIPRDAGEFGEIEIALAGKLLSDTHGFIGFLADTDGGSIGNLRCMCLNIGERYERRSHHVLLGLHK